MNSLIVNSTKNALLAGLAFCAAGLLSAQASSTYVTFSVNMATNIAAGTFVPGTDTVSANGTFNGYASFQLVPEGGTTLYTNTVDDTADANGGVLQYKYVIDGSTWEATPTGQNRAAKLPATSGASLVLPTAYFADAGAPVTNNVTFQVDVSQQIALGNFVPGSSSVEVRGLFNGWTGGVDELTNNTQFVQTNQYGLKTTNVWQGTFPVVASPGAAEAFKYVIQPATIWDSPTTTNEDAGANRFFANVAQTLPLVNFSDEPYAPLAQVTFNVNMAAVALTDTNYNPATLTLNGDFNGWSAGIPMTNNPSSANTNIYTATISVGEGSTVNYQYRYNLLNAPSSIVYDHLNGINGGSGNRVFVVPNIASTNLPAVYFNDAELNDYLTQPTAVTFTINMTNAVGTDSHVFDPTVDNLYINGQFANWYAWSGGANIISAPAGYQMMEVGLTTIYTNTIIFPPGTAVAVAYKYGIDPDADYGGPVDDETASGVNHYRVVRSTAISPYVLPTDSFGNAYNEPFFSGANPAGGQLNAGPVSGGKVPITWLGRPGAQLQVGTNLLSGTWVSLPLTDGTNWTSGYMSTNGFVSQTNWPAGSNSFFRLIKP